MTQPADSTVASPAAGVAPAPPLPRLVLAPVGFVAGCILDALIGLDAAWPLVTAGIVAAVLTLLGDLVLARVAGRLRGRARLAQGVVVILAALAISLFYRSERVDAFEQAFGTAPPSHVSAVDTEHFLITETRRPALVLRFTADRAAVDRMVGARRFLPGANFELRPGKEEKSQRAVWSSAFSRFGSEALVDRWKALRIYPLAEPHIWHWTSTDRETAGQQTSLLWDAKTGRGYAVHAGPPDPNAQ